MQQMDAHQAAEGEDSSNAAPAEGSQSELWDGMIDALVEQDPWPEEEELDPLGGVSLRTYEVVEVRAGEGIRLEECSCTTDPLPRYWIADPRAAAAFALGDVFGLGWNDEEALIWPPEGWRCSIPGKALEDSSPAPAFAINETT